MRDGDLYTIGETAAILGVSTHTLRAWERRYGAIHPLRTNSGQRRYRREDVELLLNARRASSTGGASMRMAFRMATGEALTGAPPRRQHPEGRHAESAKDTWREIADLLPGVMVIVDAYGRIVDTNVAAARMLGTVRQRLHQRLFNELVEPIDRLKAERMLMSAASRRTPWELHLSTTGGPVLYSFTRFPLPIRAGETLQALLGTEVRDEHPSDSGADRRATSATGRDATSMAAVIRSVLDRLPIGVAIATAGREPRLVYANSQVNSVAAEAASSGAPLARVLPLSAPVHSAVGEVIASGESRTLSSVSVSPPQQGLASPRSWEVSLDPVKSIEQRVTGVVVSLREASPAARARDALLAVIGDRRLEDAPSISELARVAVEHLERLLGEEWQAAIVIGPGPAWPSMRVSELGRVSEELRSSVEKVAAAACASRAALEVDVAAARGPSMLRAIPVAGRRHLRTGPLAAIVLSAAIGPPAAADVDLVPAYASRLGAALDSLELRLLDESQAARAEVVARIADAVQHAPRGHLAEAFASSLAVAAAADAVLIVSVGREGPAIQAVFPPDPDASLDGLAGLVRESTRGREAAGGVVSGAGLAMGTDDLAHAASVPLLLAGAVVGTIVLVREREFSREELALVESAGPAALLCLAERRLPADEEP